MTKLSVLGVACSVGGGDTADFERAIYAGTLAAVQGPGEPASLEALAREVTAHVTSADATPLAIGVLVCADGLPAAPARALYDAWEIGEIGPTAVLPSDDLVPALATATGWLESEADLVLILTEGSAGSVAFVLADADRHAGVPANACLEMIGVPFPVAASGVSAPDQVTVADIGYVASTQWPLPDSLVTTYRTGTASLTCAAGGVAGDGGSGAAALALAKAVLCVHRRMLVPTPQSSEDRETAWHGTPFYTVPEARPWFPEAGRPRIAHVVCSHLPGTSSHSGAGHLLVSDPAVRRLLSVARMDLRDDRVLLVLVVGDDLSELRAGMTQLRTDLQSETTDPAALAAQTCRLAAQRESTPLALALVGRDRVDLLKELGHAEEGVDRAVATGKPWRTPKGSVFAARPLGDDGLTLVYPGVFNSYIGLGRDLLQHFPDVHERLLSLTSDPGALLAEQYLYPRSRRDLAKDDLTERLAQLLSDPVAMIESGSAAAIAHAHIMQSIFGVRPRAAMGYSMGEGTMFWGSGVWRHAGAGSRNLHASPVFSDLVSGPRNAVREAWGLGPDEEVKWATFLLKAKVDRVRDAVGEEPNVYVTFVNLANEVVIAGDEAGCRRVIEALDCHALPVPASVAIHNEAMAGAHEALVDLYMHPVVAKPDVAFYSASNYDTLELDADVLAEAMATMCCQPVDFPRLVSHVYGEGGRVFLELGPLATCTRRIGRILKGKAHAAVAVNPSAGDDLDGVIRALAVLVTHRVSLDLGPLYEESAPGMLRIRPSSRATADAVPESLAEPALAGLAVAVSDGASSSVERTAVHHQAVGLVDLYTDHLLPHRQDTARVHGAFLQTRTAAQERAASLISMQIAAGRQALGEPPASALNVPGAGVRAQRQAEAIRRPRALFDEEAVRAFASGDVTDCFGPDFEAYRGRRLPRIPRGDMRMMSRVLQIDGTPHTVAPPAALVSEFDVPQDAWFYAGEAYAGLPPNIVLMEMALQPCGFLSAYLRSSFLDTEADLYFRNLDGRGRVLVDLDLRGKTVRDEVRLLSSTRGQGAIIQSYEFRMLCEGTPFYEGWSSFGYFPFASLERQVGVGTSDLSGTVRHSASVRPDEVTPSRVAAPRKLALVREMRVEAAADGASDSVLTAEGRLSPDDWFFKAHFHQDPVMPGSLGVEAAYQAMVAYARWQVPQAAGHVVRPATGDELMWKYRGQITPRDLAWRVVVRVSDVGIGPDGVRVAGSAGVWNGDIQIYRVDGMAVRLCRS